MHLDRVFVDRARGGLEAVRTWDTERRYEVGDGEGKLLYTGLEESGACERCCLGNCRGWTFHLLDDTKREVLRLQRGLACKSCCFPCCLQKMTVHADGTMLGSVTQRWNPCKPSFAVRNDSDEVVLRIKGPCKLRCSGDLQFRIKSSDGRHRVGAIAKKCSGVAKEYFDDGDAFLIAFPIDLDVKIKAVLIGACFLLDFMYYREESSTTPTTEASRT